MLAPADARIEELSARHTFVVSPGVQPAGVFFAPAPAPNNEPASAKKAPLMPRSSESSGNGNRTSAVADQNV